MAYKSEIAAMGYKWWGPEVGNPGYVLLVSPENKVERWRTHDVEPKAALVWVKGKTKWFEQVDEDAGSGAWAAGFRPDSRTEPRGAPSVEYDTAARAVIERLESLLCQYVTADSAEGVAGWAEVKRARGLIELRRVRKAK